MTKIGYARISTKLQNIDRQINALSQYGCTQIYHDKYSGTAVDRYGKRIAMDSLQEGDTLVVTEIDRLSRSLKDLIDTFELIKRKKANLIALNQGIDTSSPVGEVVFHIFSVLADFERKMILERVNDGLQQAKKQGKKLGRKPALTGERVQTFKDMYLQGYKPKTMMSTFGISRATYERYIRKLDLYGKYDRLRY